MLGNTLNACWWMASGFVVGYSIGGLFPTHLQKDLGLSPGWSRCRSWCRACCSSVSGFLWGWVADRFGRRWAMILPAIGGLVVTPLYLFTQDYTMIVVFFGLQGMFAAAASMAKIPSYLSERFPTEVRATAAGSAITKARSLAGSPHRSSPTSPSTGILALPFRWPSAPLGGLVSFIVALALGPETRGKHLTAELGVTAS